MNNFVKKKNSKKLKIHKKLAYNILNKNEENIMVNDINNLDDIFHLKKKKIDANEINNQKHNKNKKKKNQHKFGNNELINKLSSRKNNNNKKYFKENLNDKNEIIKTILTDEESNKYRNTFYEYKEKIKKESIEHIKNYKKKEIMNILENEQCTYETTKIYDINNYKINSINKNNNNESLYVIYDTNYYNTTYNGLDNTIYNDDVKQNNLILKYNEKNYLYKNYNDDMLNNLINECNDKDIVKLNNNHYNLNDININEYNNKDIIKLNNNHYNLNDININNINMNENNNKVSTNYNKSTMNFMYDLFPNKKKKNHINATVKYADENDKIFYNNNNNNIYNKKKGKKNYNKKISMRESNIKIYKPNEFDINKKENSFRENNIYIESNKKILKKVKKKKKSVNNDFKYEIIKNNNILSIHNKTKFKKRINKQDKKNQISLALLKHIKSTQKIIKWKKKYYLIRNFILEKREESQVHVIVFIIFLLLNIFINYDSGIFPVSLNNITNEFNLSITLQGFIGAIPYIGLTLASFFLGTMLQKYDQKKIIMKFMILNILNILLTFMCTNKYLFILLRFMYGLTHSVLIIYIPVWADEYAPSLCSTFWFGLIHISTVMGITIGYCFTGLLIYFNFSWMYSLLIQFFFLLLFSLCLFVIPKQYINITNIKKNENIIISNTLENKLELDDIENENNDIKINMEEIDKIKKNDLKDRNEDSFISASTTDTYNNTIIVYVKQKSNKYQNYDPMYKIKNSKNNKKKNFRIKYDSLDIKFNELKKIFYKVKKTYFISSVIAMLSCPLYMWLVFSLCNLFFVVIGIFFWSTKIFTKYLKIGALETVCYFIGTSLTAPIIGILLGSKIVDNIIGGYKEYKNRLRTLYFCVINSLLTSLMALIICLLDNYSFTLIFTWIILLFGAMLLPPITGIIMSTVKAERKSFASAFSMFLYNIFGYALGTFFPGFIVDFFNVSEAFSIKIVYMWSFFGFFNLCIATFFAKSKKNSLII